VLEENILSQVLALYQNAGEPADAYTLTQFDTDDQVWTAYQDSQALMVITWILSLHRRQKFSFAAARRVCRHRTAPIHAGDCWMWHCAAPNRNGNHSVPSWPNSFEW